MIKTDRNKNFVSALACLPPRLRGVIEQLPEEILKNTLEIRLRAGRPLMLCGSYGCCFPTAGGQYSRLFPDNTPSPDKAEIAAVVAALSENALYAHGDEINAGYITFGDGLRAGVAGTAATDGGKIKSVRDIISVNIRIARNIRGAAEPLVKTIFTEGLQNTVIYGPPLCGKTTILKDMARLLSSYPRFYRTVLADERRELSSAEGVNLDAFCGYPKKEGIEYAVRAFSPEVIICDELGTQAECDAILKSVGCGVRFIVSIHCGSREELLRRPLSRALVESRAFDCFVFLPEIGAKAEISAGKELYDEICGVGDDHDLRGVRGRRGQLALVETDGGAGSRNRAGGADRDKDHIFS